MDRVIPLSLHWLGLDWEGLLLTVLNCAYITFPLFFFSLSLTVSLQVTLMRCFLTFILSLRGCTQRMMCVKTLLPVVFYVNPPTGGVSLQWRVKICHCSISQPQHASTFSIWSHLVPVPTHARFRGVRNVHVAPSVSLVICYSLQLIHTATAFPNKIHFIKLWSLHCELQGCQCLVES